MKEHVRRCIVRNVIGEDVAEMIVSCHERGMPSSRIAKALGVPRRDVNLVLKRRKVKK